MQRSAVSGNSLPAACLGGLLLVLVGGLLTVLPVGSVQLSLGRHLGQLGRIRLRGDPATPDLAHKGPKHPAYHHMHNHGP